MCLAGHTPAVDAWSSLPRERIARWADALALPLPRGFDAACGHIAAVYADPGASLAFSHGDPAPSNNHLSPGRVRLVDFEYAGYRHALYDLTGWAILCPLPWAWLATMERVFRRALGADARGGPLADDGGYREAWATLCAYRALALLTWLTPDLLVADRVGARMEWPRRGALHRAAAAADECRGGGAGAAGGPGGTPERGHAGTVAHPRCGRAALASRRCAAPPCYLITTPSVHPGALNVRAGD